jgi:hypothetical protein
MNKKVAQEHTDLRTLVRHYQTLANAHQIEEIMTLFTKGARFEMVGQGTLIGVEAIRALHEYDKGINTWIEFQNIQGDGLTVTCECIEENDWLKAAGMGLILYPKVEFVFTKSGQIKAIISVLSEEQKTAMQSVLASFIPWLKKYRPYICAGLFNSSGEFFYTEINGRQVVDLLLKWAEEKS